MTLPQPVMTERRCEAHGIVQVIVGESPRSYLCPRCRRYLLRDFDDLKLRNLTPGAAAAFWQERNAPTGSEPVARRR